MTDENLLSHLPQCEYVARVIYHRIGKRIPLDDLIQYGRIGLLRAATLFDEKRGVKFKTFAEWKIRGAILDGIRSETKRGARMIPPLLSLAECANVVRSDFRALVERKIELERMSKLTKREIEFVLSMLNR